MNRLRTPWFRAAFGLMAIGLLAGQAVASPWLHHCADAASAASVEAHGDGHAGHEAAGAPAPCDDCQTDCAAACGVSLPPGAPAIAVAVEPAHPPTERPRLAGYTPTAPDHRLPFPNAPPFPAPLS